MVKMLWSLVLLLFIFSEIFAQNVLVNETKVHQYNQKLSHNTVVSIFQDSRGFMWFGTLNGLNRYDGTNTNIYKNDPKDPTSLSHNRITGITEDATGYIWIATSNGVSRYSRETDNFTQYYHNAEDASTISDNLVSSVYYDSQNRLWIGCNQLCLYNPDQDNFTCYPTSGVPPEQGINSLTSFICEDLSKNIWFVVPKEIHRFNAEMNKLEMIYDGYKYPVNESNWIFYGMKQDKSGNFWITTNLAGIIKTRFENPEQKLESFVRFKGFDYKEIMNTTVHSLIVDNDEIWFSAENRGIYVIDEYGNLIKKFINDPSDETTISCNSLWSLYSDHQERIWAGTWESGISILDPYYYKFAHFKYHSGINSLSMNNVKNIQEDFNGKIWIATDGGGLNCFCRTKNTFIVYKHNPADPKSIGSNAILDLALDDDGNLWSGTWDGGINIFKSDDEGFEKLNTDNSPILSNHCFSIVNGGDGKMYMASFFGGLSIYNMKDGTWEFHTVDDSSSDSLYSNVIFSMNKDSEGNFWLSADDGLIVMKRNRQNQVYFKTYLHQANDSTSISGNGNCITFEDREHNFWVGTTTGLNLMNRKTGTFKVFTTKDGLPDDAINCISQDENGNLWIGTNKGLCRFNYAKKEMRNFRISDGLQGLQFNRQASFILESGEMVFGGTGGFNIFDPGNIKDNPYVPNIVLTDFKIFNKSVPVGTNSVLTKHISETDKIKLSYKDAVISFDFVALNLTHPDENQYAYIMEGFEDSLNYIGNNQSVTYTNLKHGNYTFRVIASNNDGNWNNEGAAIRLSISAPFWKTSWFYVSIIGLLAFSIYILVRQREVRAKKNSEFLHGKVEEGQKLIQEKINELEKQKEEIRQHELVEQQMRYTNNGLAIFTEIISSNRNNLFELTKSILREIVNYVGVEMGMIFIHNQDKKNPQLQLVANYLSSGNALEKEYFMENEGYVGSCYVVNKVKIIENLPDGYLYMESGLGKASLGFLVDVPISMDTLKVGVLELASIERLEDYKIAFLQKLCENLATIISAYLTNENLKTLIEQNEEQTKNMEQQELEMLKNMEEMMATQAEFQRKEKEYKNQLEEHRKILSALQKENQELKQMIN